MSNNITTDGYEYLVFTNYGSSLSLNLKAITIFSKTEKEKWTPKLIQKQDFMH